MQISSLSALSSASSLFTPNGSQQQSPAVAGQFLPKAAKQSSSSSNMVFSLPRHSLTSAAVTQSPGSQTQLSASQAAAAYQASMNAQGLYGYQSTLGFSSLMA
jgi:hypothetical protein